MDLFSEMYLSAIFLVTSLMFCGCPPTGIEVIPGRSTIVRLGQDPEKILSTIGWSIMSLLVPQTLSVTSLILSRTLSKSVNFFLLLPYMISSNSAQGCFSPWMLFILNYKGLRVTTPDPLGRKSRPTICSSKELLPDDWFPSTTTFGNDNFLSRPISRSKSTRVMTFLRS